MKEILKNQYDINYQDVFNFANEGMYLSVYEDSCLKIIDANNKILDMLEYEREEFLKLRTTELLQTDCIEDYKTVLQELFLKDKVITELVYLTRLGKRIPVEICKSKIMMGDKEVFLTISKDISERKKLEYMKQIDDQLKSARNLAKIMIVYTDLSGKITSLTPQFCKLLGYSMEELIGKKFIDITYPKDTMRTWIYFNKLISKKFSTFEIEKRYKKKDGNIVWCYLNASLVTDKFGNPVSVLSYVQDISQRKLLEEQLKSSVKEIKTGQERFEKALKMSKIMVCNSAINGNLIKIQPRFCQLLCYTEEELLSMNFLDLIHPEDRNKNQELYEKLTREEIESIEIETRYITKNDETVWVYVNRTLVKDENNNPIHVLIFVMDITEKNKNAAVLFETNKQLQTYIKENEKLIFEIRRFRHDALNLLYGVNGYVESDDFEGLKRYFSNIQEQIKVILDDSWFSIEKIKDLSVRGLLTAKLGFAKESNIAMQIHIEKDIRINDHYIKNSDLCEILGIFIDNALESAVQAENKKVDIFIAESDEYINIIIENTFKKKPDIALLNQGFTSKGKDRGMGLGICKKILSQYPHILNNTFINHHLFVQEISIFKNQYGLIPSQRR